MKDGIKPGIYKVTRPSSASALRGQVFVRVVQVTECSVIVDTARGLAGMNRDVAQQALLHSVYLGETLDANMLRGASTAVERGEAIEIARGITRYVQGMPKKDLDELEKLIDRPVKDLIKAAEDNIARYDAEIQDDRMGLFSEFVE